MSLKTYVFAIPIILSSVLQQLFKPDDFTISAEPSTDAFERILEPSKHFLSNAFNQLKIPYEISPLKIYFTLDRDPSVLFEIQYDHHDIYEKGGLYHTHDENMQKTTGSRGISVLLQNQILAALSLYFQHVLSRSGYPLPASFTSSLTMTKRNGDQALFYVDFQKESSGRYSFELSGSTLIIIKGSTYAIGCTDNIALKQFNHFFVGAPFDESGSKTSAYYFCEFFGIEI